MTIKKQPDNEGMLSEGANDWFRQFLKLLELYFLETSQKLPGDPDCADFGLAALRAVKLTLRDSGLDEERTRELLGRVAMEHADGSKRTEWTAELNNRRFELIDRDIQRKLTPEEQFELIGLTQLMREQIDTEVNLPFSGAKKLHQYLNEIRSKATGTGQ